MNYKTGQAFTAKIQGTPVEEIWRDVKGYEGLYQVSSFGRVKSLSRPVVDKYGFRTIAERIMKTTINSNGYPTLSVRKNGVLKTKQIHQYVADAFLGNLPDGVRHVVNHIDNNKLNNHLSNLEIVTQRYNASCHRLENKKKTSKYVGVFWCTGHNRWVSKIYFNGKRIHLGNHINEMDAHNAYQNKLKEITQQSHSPNTF